MSVAPFPGKPLQRLAVPVRHPPRTACGGRKGRRRGRRRGGV